MIAIMAAIPHLKSSLKVSIIHRSQTRPHNRLTNCRIYLKEA